MFVAHCMNLITGELFDKEFDSPYKLRNFINKCSYSKKIKVLGYTSLCDLDE